MINSIINSILFQSLFKNYKGIKMFSNPLYAKYRNYKISPQRDPNELPSERVRIILCFNVCTTFLFSLSTYILTFLDVISDSFNSIIFSNASIYSILTPLPQLQYFQFISYIALAFQIPMYIFKCSNKDTLIKLYDMAYYIIPMNLLQTINNLFSYGYSTMYILYLFSNITITSITISLFIKEQLFKHPAPFSKIFTIDIPIICYYQTTIINIIFAINQIIYYIDNSLIYNENVFFGLMLILFIINVSITFSIKNIFQNILYILLMSCYLAKTFNLEERTQNISNTSLMNNTITNTTSLTSINNDTIYNMRISIIIPTILNMILISACHINNYRDRKKQNKEEQIDELKEQIL